jgi:hypothetical protein
MQTGDRVWLGWTESSCYGDALRGSPKAKTPLCERAAFPRFERNSSEASTIPGFAPVVVAFTSGYMLRELVYRSVHGYDGR